MLASMPVRSLLLITLIALAHSAVYIAHQQPDWDVAWTDQGGYRQLGAGLATSGRFTRSAAGDAFVPESIRTPGYPLFVAAVYKFFGVGNQMAVAMAQGIVFVAICLMVYGLASRILSHSGALVAAVLTALFSPIPYFGALVMTEVWATFMLTATLLATMRLRERSDAVTAVVAGALAAGTALTRPAFVLLPLLLFGVMAAVDGRRLRRAYATAAVAAAVTLLPWFAHNYVYFNRITISPANGLGRAVWEASWQGVWDGRLQNDLTLTAERLWDRTALDSEVRRMAEEAGLDPAPMLAYVHQWQDIRRPWMDLTDRRQWMLARIEADGVYFRTGIENALQDPISHFKRRLLRGVPVLWIGEIPYRYSQINRLPTWLIRAIWGAQAALILLAAGGAWACAAAGRWREALLLGVPFVYITAVHAPLLTEARQSLPGMPAVIVLAATGLAPRQWLKRHEVPPRL